MNKEEENKVRYFTRLIESEKTNNNIINNEGEEEGEEEEDEEEELRFAVELDSPQPQPDLLVDLHDTNNEMDTADLKKELKESRVFAKVCVANLRRSFGDLTDIDLSPSKFEMRKMSETKDPKICKSCSKEVFLVELVKAEKAFWHKNCFRCTDCNKQMTVDNYSSNEGRLYCKPHFKLLFQPKVVIDEEVIVNKNKEIIIRENIPATPPPDVIRSNNNNTIDTSELQELDLDLRSKFEMFENYKEPEKKPAPQPHPQTSIQSKLKAFKKECGIKNEELGDFNDSDEEESSPLTKIKEIIAAKELSKVRSKWEEGFTTEANPNKKTELAKFRSRLCQGKNGIKDVFEKGFEKEIEDKKVIELEYESSKVRDFFERGVVVEEVEREIVEIEGVVQNSRKVFVNLEKGIEKVFEEDEDDDVYRDPNIIRASSNKEIIKSKTASKMLDLFKKMENSCEELKPRPLKEFTPPRENIRVEVDSDEEIEVEEFENDVVDDEKDAFLKEVGSLARARSLRARFEAWEAEENKNNKNETNNQKEIDSESIESARILRERFETLQKSKDSVEKKPILVKRFVVRK